MTAALSLIALSAVCAVYAVVLAWGAKNDRSVNYSDWWMKAVGAVILAICAAALAIATCAWLWKG